MFLFMVAAFAATIVFVVAFAFLTVGAVMLVSKIQGLLAKKLRGGASKTQASQPGFVDEGPEKLSDHAG
ncbi:hypothetical protein SGCZBJ_01520 [Caulobacter zeae]|uniref:Uncharacterized protein n=1 Tax=Caulobacter zeae TaxID=2055137 RepID=A0A2N5DRG5_9CAUL|nr:hypothetical protein [Caulobacter zeae]PLR28656.1 hypothetical protein SGCZBJ_01520 [Caulobacter zeae]